MRKIVREVLTCQECGNVFDIQIGVLQKRREKTSEPICPLCYKLYSRGGRFGKDYYPEILRDKLNDEYWDYDLVKPFIETLKTKKKVKFICQECGNEDIMSIKAMQIRKICGTKPICRKCSERYAKNSQEWLNNNSKAQKIAQNRPETLKKQRDSQLKLMREDPMYADKRCSKSYVSGKIRDIRFDSSWELCFLAYCWENVEIKSIERFVGSISYVDPKSCKRKYYPDFFVKYSNGKTRIVEIKGSKEYNNFHEKFNAGIKEFGSRYVVYGLNDLYNMGIYVRRETYLREFYRKYYDEIVFYENSKTESLKVKIKKWLK